MLYDNINYPGLTTEDVRNIYNLNQRNHYGISYIALIRLTKQHERARNVLDERTKSKIEFRLTDLNFHHECAMLCDGEYQQLLDELRQAQKQFY